MRRSLPKPEQLDLILDDICHLTDGLGPKYRDARDIGYEKRTRGERSGVSSHGSTSDPTGNIIASERNERIRDDVARAVADIESAKGLLQSAERCLARALDDDKHNATDPFAKEKYRAVPKISPTELAAAQSYRAKRVARGEE